ncbi:hypothetical protein KFK09_016997 [Dendrobium nobile]|uniref:Integrase catalytic domain-containing protein n=1 Tax=Dendrobium nobile TaxID=94219 RepID=A0A8T3B278_DENNO|nr:hypothetical protein KFK09_016997 [Dendrobium nobile]
MGSLRFLKAPSSTPPEQILSTAGIQTPNPTYQSWILQDQNLAAALCSTIALAVLPYILHLESTCAIWASLELRFQSSNHSKVIQLKNELHHISMNSSTMTQHLTKIKSLVDQMASAGSNLDTEDVILYILNGLPPTYQSFKTSIRTMLHPISLDNLYTLLLSEEINIAMDAARITTPTDPNLALYSYRVRERRGRGRNSYKNSNAPRQTSTVICQICTKKGHSAPSCWHRTNLQYTPTPTPTNNTALAANSNQPFQDWYQDTGASSHITNSLDKMTTSHSYQGTDTITVGDGRSVSISHTGDGILPTPDRKIHLAKLLHLPNIRYNLISISQLTKDNNLYVVFYPHGYTFKDLKMHQTILAGPCHDRLYTVPATCNNSSNTALIATQHRSTLWHNRLGHHHNNMLTTISKNNPTLHIPLLTNACTNCKASKGTKLVFENSEHKQTIPLTLIHSDVWGPSPIKSVQGFRYYVIFVDDFSRFTWIFPMRNKSEVPNIFISFKAFIEKQLSTQIKCLRTDGGSEYLNNTLTSFLTTNYIHHQISCPYTPEQNGLAKRKHRHIGDTTRTLLSTSSVPYIHWPEATLTVVYLINRMPSNNTQKLSPYHLLFNKSPDYSLLRTFGCECYPLTPSHLRHKLQPKAISSIFLGYSESYKGFKCLNPKTNKIHFSRHVMFLEHSFLFKNNFASSPTVASDIPPSLLTPTSTQAPNSHTTSIPPSHNTPIISNSSRHSAQATIPSPIPYTSLNRTLPLFLFAIP